MSLFELRDIIDTDLHRLDSMYGGAFEAVQSDTTHTFHVLVPKEDARFRLGILFPTDSDLSINDFVAKEGMEVPREQTRPFLGA
jgi:hypothetical protein